MRKILVTERNIKAVTSEINKIFKSVSCKDGILLQGFSYSVGDYQRRGDRRPKRLCLTLKNKMLYPSAFHADSEKGYNFFSISCESYGSELVPIIKTGSLVLIDNLSVHIITKPFMVGGGRTYHSFVPTSN